ncbi:MAG: hypothetical protein EXS36_03890 [Pedosphaera sp.]|nr:hypothetical protein [Pedosphaera sp.]
MRFQRLQIPAFGPFTNLDLQFPNSPGDLHIIYGANEAGKSSLLRAIRDLLFGIHSQSADNFLHGYAELRIKGEIRNRAGGHLVFQRRKGNKNTLLDAEGQPLPDGALVPFLGSVDASYFSAMFGLGSRELHEGAQQLLRGEGDLGNALFSASLGGTPVQKVVEALEQEAEFLFKGRATSNVSIRPASNRYRELLKQSRDATVNPEAWDTIEKDLAEAEGAKKHLEEEISKRERELQWISRCEDALPTVGRLIEERQKIAQLPPLPELASDFRPRAQASRKTVSEAQTEVQRLTAQIGKLQTQLLSCQIAPSVLAEAARVDQLHQDLGAYKDRKKSLADLRATLGELDPLMRAGMHNLELKGEFTSLENHRLSRPIQLACEAAAAALKVALAEHAANSGKAEDLTNQIRAQEIQAQALPETDLTDLREALAVAAEATEADRSFSTSESEVQRMTRETADSHRQLVGAPSGLEATVGLPVPALATLRRYQERMEGIRRDIENEKEKLLEANKRAGAIQAELSRQQRKGELPSEEALLKARKHRDYGWSLVLAEWKGDGAKEDLVPGLPLEEVFPQTIANADGIADRLRFQAEAVAKAEEKRFQLGETEAQIGAVQRKILELQGALDECDKSWQTEWFACGITPRSPLEMEEWRDDWSEFRERLGKLRTAQESLQEKRHQIQQAKCRLASVLQQSEQKEFSLLFASARKLVQDGEQAAGRRIEMANQLGALEIELAKFDQSRARLAAAVDTSVAEWKSKSAAVGLPEGTSPDAGLILLRERKDLLAKFDEWRELSNKFQLAADAIAKFEQTVGEIAVALGLKGDSTEAIESALWRALTEARKAQDRHDQLAEQIGQANDEQEDATLRATQSDQTLRELIQLASINTIEELEALLAHLELRDAAQARMENLRNTLSGLARGQAVDEFVSQVRAENPDALAERKATAAREKSEKESAFPGIRETLFRIGNEKTTLEKAGDAAADFRQQAESCAATLKQDAARFLRLRLATHLLQTQIERFRKENQGPLLEKSGDIFQAITRGAFSGLDAEFNADDLPVLVGVRPDRTKVLVEGLSDGSRDQLYLALRLAALDRYLQEHEPMPLILDDLLITFDDSRAKAILPQLSALAKRAQIFVFTHHEHLVELCRQTLGDGQFHLHRLGQAGGVLAASGLGTPDIAARRFADLEKA